MSIARAIIAIFVMLALAACQQAATPAAVDAAPSVQPKQLATVYISPTPNAAEQQATQLAAQPSLTAPPPTAVPSPTVYVGVFLEAAAGDDEAPILNATQAFELVPGLPTARPSRCQIAPDDVFGDLWRSEIRASQTLGCPIEVAVRFEGIVQVFERGVMYYQANGPIWAIETTNDGFTDKQWTITQQLPPVENPPANIVPPDGLSIPKLGFGAVWFGVEGVRQTLGFARTDEQKVELAFQRFENGALLGDVSTGVSFILLSDGTSYGPF